MKRFRQAAPDHRLNDLLARKAGGDVGGDDLSVPQHRDAVRDLERLFQRVRDENDRDAFVEEPLAQIEEVALLFRRERRRWLIEDDDARVVVDRPRDLDHLLLRRAERRDLRRRIDLETHAGEKLPRLYVEAPQPVEGLFLAQIDILRDRHGGDEIGLLIDHHDPVPEALGRGRETHGLAIEGHFAGGQAEHAGDHLGERRFSSAILPEKRMDLARVEGEVHVAKSRDASEAFRSVADFNDRGQCRSLRQGLKRVRNSQESPGPFARHEEIAAEFARADRPMALAPGP